MSVIGGDTRPDGGPLPQCHVHDGVTRENVVYDVCAWFYNTPEGGETRDAFGRVCQHLLSGKAKLRVHCTSPKCWYWNSYSVQKKGGKEDEHVMINCLTVIR